jgi:hypothetical protein
LLHKTLLSQVGTDDSSLLGYDSISFGKWFTNVSWEPATLLFRVYTVLVLDWCSKLLCNIGNYLPTDKMSYPRRLETSSTWL